MNFCFYSKYNGKSTIEQLRRVTFLFPPRHFILSIDSDKLSDEANNLLQVLDRNLSKSYMPYDHSADSQSGSVISPVTNKEMSAKAWMKILLNTKIGKEEKSIWSDDQNCFLNTHKPQVSEN